MNNSTELSVIKRSVRNTLQSHFDSLESQAKPVNSLHKMVVEQAESGVLEFVMEKCNGNQSRAAEQLGIARGTLRTKLAKIKENNEVSNNPLTGYSGAVQSHCQTKDGGAVTKHRAIA